MIDILKTNKVQNYQLKINVLWQGGKFSGGGYYFLENLPPPPGGEYFLENIPPGNIF